MHSVTCSVEPPPSHTAPSLYFGRELSQFRSVSPISVAWRENSFPKLEEEAESAVTAAAGWDASPSCATEDSFVRPVRPPIESPALPVDLTALDPVGGKWCFLRTKNGGEVERKKWGVLGRTGGEKQKQQKNSWGKQKNLHF